MILLATHLFFTLDILCSIYIINHTYTWVEVLPSLHHLTCTLAHFVPPSISLVVLFVCLGSCGLWLWSKIDDLE